MIKCETAGMIEVSKNNPVLTSNTATANFSFITDNNILYLIANEPTGDASYVYDYEIPAGEFMRGFQVDAWIGQKLIVDGKHIAYASGKSYEDLAADDILTVTNAGKLEVADDAPDAGIYFKITDKVTLTEAAVKVLICKA